jgi:hypothetical protein
MKIKLLTLAINVTSYKKNTIMKKNLFFIMALLCAVAQGTWAQTTWSGSGNSTGPYLLKTSDEWEALARM